MFNIIISKHLLGFILGKLRTVICKNLFLYCVIGFFVFSSFSTTYLPAAASTAQAGAEISNDVLLEKINSMQQSQTVILEQIRTLREDMNMRFEQVDKRFEQVDERFEFIQNLLVALLIILVGTTIYSVLGKTKEKRVDDSIKIKEVIEREERLEKIVKEIVNKDEELRKRLQTYGLL